MAWDLRSRSLYKVGEGKKEKKKVRERESSGKRKIVSIHPRPRPSENSPLGAQRFHRQLAQRSENKESVLDVKIVGANKVNRSSFGDSIE